MINKFEIKISKLKHRLQIRNIFIEIKDEAISITKRFIQTYEKIKVSVDIEESLKIDSENKKILNG